MAKTFKFAQRDISKNVDRNSARKVFDLSLTQFGPYVASDWTRNGKCVPAVALARPRHTP